MMKLSLGFWAISFFLLGSLLIDAAHGSIHEYKNRGFVKMADALYFHGGHQGLYASESLGVSSSSDAASLKGKSFIRFDDISIVRTKESAKKQNATQASAGLVEAILFEAKQQDRVGGSLLKTENMCCSPKLADAGSCNLGEVIITSDPNDPEWPKQIPISFKRGEEEAKMSPEVVVINRTGWYILYFITCDPGLDGAMITGKTVWKNLDGYLPGQTAPLLKFYLFMFLPYAGLCIVWLSKVFRHWKDGIHLHSHITLVIAFSANELSSLFSELAYLDITGTSPVVVTLWAVTVSSVRKALSRLLLLFISSGYGLVKPNLGGITLTMLLVGVLCFVISESLGLAIHYGNVSENVMTSLMLSWAILEACFLRWIFRSLWKTLKKLKLNKRNIVKLQLYEKFATVLIIMVVLNFAWIYVEVSIYDSLSKLWQLTWIIPAFWYMLTYALLILITSYWHPSEKPTRYLYVAEMEEFEEEDLSLAEAGMVIEEDGEVARNERESVLEGIIQVLGGAIPRER